jgi:hypothetical protein
MEMKGGRGNPGKGHEVPNPEARFKKKHYSLLSSADNSGTAEAMVVAY